MVLGAPMLTVGANAYDVECRLTWGRVACPGCGHPLSRWGHGRPRMLRGDGQLRWRLRPRRARCGRCRVTHVLLPITALLRRADSVAVIGAALAEAAGGRGHRRIAADLGRPAATVRGWLRRFAARAGPIREVFIAVLCELDPDPVPPRRAGSQLADAVAAVAAAAAAAASRFGDCVVTVSAWELAAAVTSGTLLAPGPAVTPANTSRLFRAGG